jgi:hypothetical protein
MYIGIIGHMGHGKTSRVGHYLENHGFKRFHPAETLRSMLRVFLIDLGIHSTEVTRYLEGDLKRSPIPGLPGITGTNLQQTLGTEWGRNCVHQGIWNDILAFRLDTVKRRSPGTLRAFNDSIRFPNEAEHALSIGGILIRVTRPGFPTDLTHASEKHIPLLPYHYEVINKDGESSTFVNNQMHDILTHLRAERELPPLKYSGAPQPPQPEFLA